MGELLWNHRVHQQWAGEDLSFWRLAFFPRFRETEVVEKIEDVLSEAEVSSYAIYETLGLFDLFIRAWLPSQSHEVVERALDEALQGEYLQLLESFTVNRVLRHHVWDDGQGNLLEPETAVLKNRLKDEEVHAINEGRLSRDRFLELKDLRLIAELEPAEGIKFFTIITSSAYSSTFGARRRLEDDLLATLGQAGLDEVSLYEGSGFGNFVVMGRAKRDDFFAIPALANAINDLGIYEAFIARPYTHICGSEELIAFHERIPTSRPREPLDVRSLLERPESIRLEVKGSLHLDWGRWFATGEEGDPQPNEDVVNGGLVKAVVGMLNADGGDIVLGALERDRFAVTDGTLDPRLAGYEEVGDYVVVGIDAEERYKAGEWDAFRLHLQDILAERIDPSPAGLINLTPASLGGRSLAVVSVQPSATTWFYRILGPKDPVRFFVREDGRTVTYAGSDADNYKRAQPRG